MMQGEQQDIEGLLRSGKSIQIKLQGYSMYPVLVPGRDEAIIESVGVSALKRGDVVLYRRDVGTTRGILVLHRIWKRTEAGFYMVGDNQKEIEGPLREEQIKGIMVGFIRKGKYISAKDFRYRLLTGIWLMLRPLRPMISKMAAKIKRSVKKHV